MPFIKLNQPKYLSQGQYLIADTDPDSTYFDVSEVPDILTGGKNLFMIKGNKDLLAPGSTIEIEVTDLNGRVIYHENANYIEPGTKRRAVAIYVYESTPQGGGIITITGTAQKRPNGKSVSLELQKTLNVKWQKRLNVLPFRENQTRVIMTKSPAITIKEVERTYLTPSGSFGTIQVSDTLANISYTLFDTGEGQNQSMGSLSTTSSYFAGTDVGTSILLFGGTSELPANYYDPEAGANGAQAVHVAVGGPTGVAENGSTMFPDIINVTAIGGEPVAIIAGALKQEVFTQRINAFTGEVVDGFESDNFFIFPQTVTGLGANHVHPSAYSFETQIPNSESWAKVFISNLDPICGDIASVKVYKRSQGFQQWQFVEDANLEVVELLENNDSNAISQNLGEFNTQTIVDEYWTGSLGGVNTNFINEPPITASNGTIFVNGVVISGSELLLNYESSNPNGRDDAYVEYRMKPSADWNSDGTSTAGIDIPSAGSYTVTLKAASEVVSDGESGVTGIPSIRIYASGSAIDPDTDGDDKLKLTTITYGTEAGGNSLDVLDALESSDNLQLIYDEDLLSFDIDVQRAGTIALIFQIPFGRWYLSDISIKSSAQTGWTPNYTIINFYVANNFQQVDFLDFKFELYDNLGNKVFTKQTNGVEWTGGNLYINGSNNVLDGTIEIG